MIKFIPSIFMAVLPMLMLAQNDWISTVEDVYSFSSPRAADLNNDGILDIVVGTGEEGVAHDNAIVAIDGADGTILWEAYARDQIFGSALFLDVNDDGFQDVFIGGRAGEFRALNGQNGALLWEFYEQAATTPPADVGVYQFYTPQWIPDQDGDDLPDLLSANGGDPTALLPNDPRPAGQLMVMSSATGELLAQAEVPDEQENYMSPLVVDFFGDGGLEIIFGTGGEGNGGSLWRVDLADLLQDDLSQAIPLVTSNTKGMIAPPSLADLNSDNVPDIVVNTYDGRIIAIDGVSNDILWQQTIEMGETNASPAIGYFNDDDVPDVFCNYGIGLAPTFIGFIQIMLDGATGEVLWEDELGQVQFVSPLAVDIDEDGTDEVIFSINNFNSGDTPPHFVHEIFAIDFNDDEITSLTGQIGGANVNSTPWIGNLDDDGMLDMIYTYNVDSTQAVTAGGIYVKKETLSTNDAIFVSWGAYIGTNYNGLFDHVRSACIDTEYDLSIDIETAEGCMATLTAVSTGCEGDCTYTWSNDTNTQSTTVEATGRHTVKIHHADGCVQVVRIDIADLFGTVTIEPALCADGAGSSVRIDYGGGVPPYTTNFNGSVSGGTTTATVYALNNLPAGTYDFSVTDANDCVYTTSIVLETVNPLIVESTTSPVTEIPANGTIDLTVSGGTVPYTFDWIGNDNWTTSSLSNVEGGMYVVEVSDANGCTVMDTVVVDSFLGVETETEKIDIRAYPVPNMGIFNIETDEIQLLGTTFRMYDSNARLVLEDKLTSNKQYVNISTFPSGVYYIVLDYIVPQQLIKVVKY